MDGLLSALNLPDLWQQEAARHLASGMDVIIDAPTGAGKTRVFELLIESTPAARHGQAVFTVPTRALANDKWREWQARGWNVGLATGDRAENINAPVLVATLETQRERILAGRAPNILVIDEYQMIADAKRGLNYELALALLPLSARILLLSGSVKNPHDVADWMRRSGREVRLVEVKDRPVPLEELPIEQLPRVPDGVHGFWPRLAAGARQAGLTPLLIFAPRRADAEKIAKKVAEGLPAKSPLSLPIETEQQLGKDLAKSLRKRVAFHHSGLSYHARAGWIEPLAKNGHLDVIVATTGLAAGINFSVRSVIVAETKYFDGPYQRELRPDELLQMFGRAGRRGLDTRGTVLVAPHCPRLFDAAPRHLRRVNEIDWPTLLRIMEEAAIRAQPPLEAATSICTRLFSKQSINLGIEPNAAPHDDTLQERPGYFDPTREEILDGSKTWIAASQAQAAFATLDTAITFYKDRWRPALRVATIVEPLGPGRLCKVPQPNRSFIYAKELPIARQLPDGRLSPHPWLRKRIGLTPEESFSEQEFFQTLIPLLENYLAPGQPGPFVYRNNEISLRLTFGHHRVSVWVDGVGRHLLNPPTRRTVISHDTDYRISEIHPLKPRPGSAAHAWRKLGLVDASGIPTTRGRVFSRFQNGEGLMIAAALEDPKYPVEEIVIHLANLRGGYRFHEFAGGTSDHLAYASRATYGHIDYSGYLDAGLCPGYGEGTAEAIDRFRSQGMTGIRNATQELRSGDIERALLEWMSLLRHIVHAPDAHAPRWMELQAAAQAALRGMPSSVTKLESDLPAHLQHRAEPRTVVRNPR